MRKEVPFAVFGNLPLGTFNFTSPLDEILIC
jgi:hypothetical protein